MMVNRFFSSFKKEYILLINDKVGLLFMFLMPLVLVVLLTVVQDSAYRRINENQISLLLVCPDTGKPAKHFTELIKESGFFRIEEDPFVQETLVKDELIRRKKLAAIYIPENFSDMLIERADNLSNLMFAELLSPSAQSNQLKSNAPFIAYYHDPILQESYNYTITNVLYSYLNIVESSLLLDMIYGQLGLEAHSDALKDALLNNRIEIHQSPASPVRLIPNSTQHNVPAWTIFAMFFMVISLGSNIVREKMNGSFMRLKTMPVTFSLIFGSKLVVYVLVALLQVTFIFSIGVFVFPAMNLPKLIIPHNFVAVLYMAVITAIAAVSYAFMIGSLAKTQEQANGFGAVSIIIFAALGGVLVPVFIMPDILKIISKFSPLYWCLEGFYILFLKGGNFVTLFVNTLPILLFIAICQGITYIQLKKERII